jgi:predicted ArsR family transcriptional regulator
MLSDAERDYVDQVGRHFAKSFGLPPVVGRVIGWLLICDPPRQTAAGIAEGLGISRSAVGQAVSTLENWNVIERTRPPGERADRIGVHAAFGADNLEAADEYAALATLARKGLELLRDAPPGRRARLMETAALADFLLERMPQIAADWRERRAAMHASGELPRSE